MLIDVLSLAEQDTHFSRKHSTRHEKKGPCPNMACRCRTDGFSVKWDSSRQRWVWMCRGCWDSQEYVAEKGRKRGWGDEIDYLRHYKGMTFKQAKAVIGDEGENEQIVHSSAPRGGLAWNSDEWQRRTDETMQDCMARIWDEQDTTALDYARSRGFTDETIRHARMGYSTRDGIPRLIVPSLNDGRYVEVMCRDMRPGIDERWKDSAGSTKSELYLADCLKSRTLPTVLCEDAFSALSVAQTSGDIVNAVATCSATCGRSAKWLALLACQPLVLVALDADADGDYKAAWWLERLPNAVRMRPLLKDINDMLMDGWDIRGWIAMHLPSAASEIETEEEVQLCSRCLNDGIDTPALEQDYEGLMYCSAHHPLLAPIQATQEPATSDENVEFKHFAQRLAVDVWQGNVTVEVLHERTDAYIAMRKAEVQAEYNERFYARHIAPMRDVLLAPQKLSIPTWLQPNTPEWNATLEHLYKGTEPPLITYNDALAELTARRQAWLNEPTYYLPTKHPKARSVAYGMLLQRERINQ